MNNLSALIKTREILSDPSHWTQGSYAMTSPAHAEVVNLDDSRITTDLDAATCFCLHGAFCKASGQGLWSYHHSQLNKLLSGCLPKGYQSRYGDNLANVTGFNDEPNRTHEEILQVLDCAIERARAKAKVKAEPAA